MARKMSRREIGLLIGLGVIVVAWFAIRDGGGFGGGRSSDPEGDLAALTDAPVVRMDLLEPGDAEFDQGGRDLFKYGEKPLTDAEREALRRRQEAAKRQAEEAEKRAAERAEAVRNTPPPRPPQPKGPSLPRIDLRYLGYLGPKDDRIAVFADGADVLLARTGEIVKEQFRVVEIQFESVVMGYTRPDLESKTQTLTMARK